MRHPILTLIAVLTAIYVLVRHPEFVFGTVVAVAVFVLFLHWLTRRVRYGRGVRR